MKTSLALHDNSALVIFFIFIKHQIKCNRFYSFEKVIKISGVEDLFSSDLGRVTKDNRFPKTEFSTPVQSGTEQISPE